MAAKTSYKPRQDDAKPVEALQWSGDVDAVEKFLGDGGMFHHVPTPADPIGLLLVATGARWAPATSTVQPNGYIVRHGDGRLEAVSTADFARRYEV